MKHITREEVALEGLLRATRTIAVVGASPRHERHSYDVVSYLHGAGYDVIPVRPDRAAVAGVPSFASFDDFGGSVDLVVIFRRPDAVVEHIRQAAAKRAEAVWLPPGVWSREAEEAARTHHLKIVKERCIIETHKHLTTDAGEPTPGHPKKQGVHVGRRRRPIDEDTITPPDSGFVEGGGGGHKAGGGKHSVLDEKKMTGGRGR